MKNYRSLCVIAISTLFKSENVKNVKFHLRIFVSYELLTRLHLLLSCDQTFLNDTGMMEIMCIITELLLSVQVNIAWISPIPHLLQVVSDPLTS